jgi:peptidoglycan/xylan/chitin deacetylase (PgdA/CDA1 family)
MTPYEPRRDLLAKVARRAAQAHRVAPVEIARGTPRLSVTFDDAPKSAVEAGAAVLESFGLRGTFYLCGGLSGADSPHGRLHDVEDPSRLVGAGHEVGCHTVDHRDLAVCGADGALAGCASNALALRLSAPPVSFAYPFGETTVAVKRALAGRFETARGIAPGVNVGAADRMHLRAVRAYGPDADAACAPWLERAHRRGGWLILFTHDVAAQPSRWGTTPGALERVLESALQQGFIVQPVRDAARALIGPAIATPVR